MHLDVTSNPPSDDIALVRDALHAFNAAKAPEIPTFPEKTFNVILQEQQRIVAGAICEIYWGWVYFETVWTDPNARGKGYGRLVMNAAETFALEQGIDGAYLLTTSFQAKPFYEKLGYAHIGQHIDRPIGHVFHYMSKTSLQVQPIDPRITIEYPLNDANADFLDDALVRYIDDYAPIKVESVAIFLRDEHNVIRGGMVGNMFWDWLDMRLLWVDESLRRQGWGKKLLSASADVCKQQGSIGIVCDVASFQAVSFFEHQGFRDIAALENRPPGYKTHFLQKRL